jgi:diguanylate cyclase (GGDEF)-like protein
MSQPPAAASEAPHILVVDDDPLLRDALNALLTPQGPVVVCDSGESGIAAVNEETEVVILDVKMLRKDGFETCKEIQAKFPHVPVIFFTAHQDLRAPFDIMNDLHPFAYVSKGGNHREIIDTVRSARAYHQQRQENVRLVKTLQSLNQDLEKRVQERTRALEEAVQKNQLLSMTDSLTNVPNRRHFFQEYARQLQQAMRTRRPFALMVVDIDGFKQINDTHGHLHGDAVLKDVAHILRDNLRSIDALGRIGGDEFALALPETDLHGAQQVGERLRRSVAALTFVPRDGGAAHPVSLSIGACVLGEEMPHDADLFFHSADRALYDSKHAGRDRVTCTVYTAQPPS